MVNLTVYTVQRRKIPVSIADTATIGDLKALLAEMEPTFDLASMKIICNSKQISDSTSVTDPIITPDHILIHCKNKQQQIAPKKPQPIEQPKSEPPQPNGGFGQPNTGFGQPNGGVEQPNAGFGQPNSEPSQPNTGFGQPNTGFGQPNAGFGQPNTGPAHPSGGQAGGSYDATIADSLRSQNAFIEDSNNAEYQTRLQALQDMGFPKEDCERALRMARGNHDFAVEFLLSGNIPSQPIRNMTITNDPVEQIRQRLQENPLYIIPLILNAVQQRPELGDQLISHPEMLFVQFGIDPSTVDMQTIRSELQRQIGFGQLNPGFGQPNTGFGQPNTGFGQPNTGFGQPNAGFGQPNGGFGQPNPGFGQPNGGFGQPNGGFGQPNPGFGQPNGGFGQPNTGFGQPNGGYGQPSGGYQQESNALVDYLRQVSPEKQVFLQQLVNEGYDAADVIQIFAACDQNEEETRSILQGK